jgi:patatin-related protein
MSEPQTNADAPERPRCEFTQEIRFAVVMYGGSSLAIYINGVAQELRHMVRATAPEPDGDGEAGCKAYLADEQLEGGERIYRHIGRLLSRGEPPARVEGADDPRSTRGLDIRTRLVVDILTGSSAGGINGIYLAKALANDQDIKELKTLWVTEGDIGALINDETSYLGLNLKPIDGEPWSLLNSRRMYLKLLDALRGMDTAKTACETGRSPLVDDLDLYVTSTDIAGRVIQMRLADGPVSERRHRNVFHFRYRSGRADERDPNVSDFGPEYNAFLAFAARATSAHQAAFAPVKLDDVGPIVKDKRNTVEGEYLPEDPRLSKFYREYLLQRAGEDGKGGEIDPKKLARAFHRVWFNDGGTLDNKPFSFAIEQLPRRQAGASVDRKLLYVEPSPEHLRFARAAKERPRIAQNAWGGLSTLPSYETIVEDLARVLERNRLIERVRHITEDFEDDIKTRRGGLTPPRGRDEMRGVRMEQLIAEKGAAWGGYQRLRIAQVTDDLTLLIARAAGIDEDSDEYTAIRHLVRYWRRSRYDDHDPKKEAETGFLLDYDLQWTLRRVRFVLRKLDELACFDARAEKLAALAEEEGTTVTWPGEPDPQRGVEGDSPERKAELVGQLRPHLRELREELSKVLAQLNAAARAFWAYREDVVPGRLDAEGRPVYLNPFRDDVAALGVTSQMLRDFLWLKTEGERVAYLNAHLAERVPTGSPAEPGAQPGEWTRLEAFEALAGKVRGSYEVRKRKGEEGEGDAVEEAASGFVGEIGKARTKCYSLLHAHRGQLDAGKSVSRILHFYFRFFEDFDQVTFPIFYSTDVGEEMDPVEVFRVSPEDARAIVDEKRDKDEDGEPVLKLAGTTLGHFGAFFERKFRINDIMWGRLDGAERIIAALLPTDEGLRKSLTRRAHAAIIEDEAGNKIDLAWKQAQEVFGGLKESERGGARGAQLFEKVKQAADLMHEDKDCRPVLNEIRRGLAKLREGSRWRLFLESFVTEFEPFASEFIAGRKRGNVEETLRAFKHWFETQYREGRRFTPEATRETAFRAHGVLGGMALGYFPEEGKRREWQRFLLWLGKRVQIFVGAAIKPDSDAYRKLRFRLTLFYVLSAVLFVAGALVYIRWRGDGLPKVSSALLTVLIFLLGVGPLLLTAAYHFAWRKTRRAFASLLSGGKAAPAGKGK